MRALLWLLMAALLVGTLVGAKMVRDSGGKPAAGPTGTGPETPEYVSAVAFVEAEGGPVDLYVQQPGRVVEVSPTRTADGKDRVFKEGEVIIRVDSKEAEFMLKKAQAALREAQARLDQAKKLPEKHSFDVKQQQAAIDTVKQEGARQEAEYKLNKRKFTDLVSEQTKLIDAAYDEAKKLIDEKLKLERLKLDQLNAVVDPTLEITRAEADKQIREADVDLAKRAVKEATLVAPRDGTVLRVFAKVGEFISPQLRTPAVEFCPNTARVVKAEVLQEWANYVRAGQDVAVEDDIHQGKKWDGRVKFVSDWIAPKRIRLAEPFMVNDVRTLECLIEFTAPDPDVRIGQRVRVRIKVKGDGN